VPKDVVRNCKSCRILIWVCLISFFFLYRFADILEGGFVAVFRYVYGKLGGRVGELLAGGAGSGETCVVI
jgi:hypothetical protein